MRIRRWKSPSAIAILLAISVCTLTSFTSAAAPASNSYQKTYKERIEPLLEKYCYDCHGGGMDKGEVAMDKFDTLDQHFQNYKLWIAVWKNVQSQLMPPAKKAQPSDEERHEIFEWIERAVFKVDPDNPDPGRVTIRRLNREEYRNTVYDLFNVRFNVTDAFPADDTGYGFDTIGDVLNISPLLMEKYVDAAEEIVGEILKNSRPRIPTLYVEGSRFKVKEDPRRSAESMPYGTDAIAETTRTISYPGRYRISVEMRGNSATRDPTSQTAHLRLLVNGKEQRKLRMDYGNRRDMNLVIETELPKGEATLALDLISEFGPDEGEYPLTLSVNSVQLYGPLDGSHTEYPSEYRRVFVDGPPPADAKARQDYARKILRNAADRAFRRPIDEPTLNRLVTLATTTESQPGMNFEKGIGHAMSAILASPRFLFRAEIQPEPNNPGKTVPIDEFSLASRLSYFLWSSAPDEELFNLARESKLRSNLRAQVDRMLKDTKSERFVRNFTGQWLQLRDVESINVDASRILRISNDEIGRIFGGTVRRAMRDETEMLFTHILRENRSPLELLTANYTFLNEPLARFYGMTNGYFATNSINGFQMRKVEMPEEAHRKGMLTHGSFLLVTSNPTRTSPVKRGLFVLENVLGTPAPPAPPNVPPLEEIRRSSTGPRLTMRERMVEHREKPLCSSCHARMDPIGLGLENFNALGQWRETEYDKPIDSAGQLITGEKFENSAQLADILAGTRRMDFYRCLTEKLLTYALGRGPEYYDSPTIDRLAERLDKEKGTLASLVVGIIESAPFQKRRGDGEKFSVAGPESGTRK